MRPVSRFARLVMGVTCLVSISLSAQAGVIEMIEPGQVLPKEEPAAQTPPECVA